MTTPPPRSTRPLARYLAVDYGERRVGLAVSDPEGLIASPAGFITRRLGKRPPIAELVRQAEALAVRGFVLGLPLDDQGEETMRSTEVRAIALELTKRTTLPVRLVDERYTTAAALRAIREMGGSARGRKGDVDALAATLLLRHAMDIAANEAAAARIITAAQVGDAVSSDDSSASRGAW